MASKSLYLPATLRPVLSGTRPRGTVAFSAMTVGFAGTIVLYFVSAVEAWTPMTLAMLPLLLATATWISGGAATAVMGLFTRPPRSAPAPGWSPTGKTAVLITLCREDPKPVAAYLAGLRSALDRVGLRGGGASIFVLSDTSGAAEIAAEQQAFCGLAEAGVVHYRRRPDNEGRKPGNIADWLDRHGDGFDYMLVLDADSRMSADRIRRMVCRMEARPRLGLLQAGIALTPGRTRFGRHQRTASRLLGPTFVRGFGAWAGRTGNYWGHNALIRVAAFRPAARLPVLPGPAPWGGILLSHDFVEAAWIRREGWHVELDVEQGGSAEDAPQTLEDFHRRDRRWCQGNLQHLRLLRDPGLHPLSRIHMASGVFSYLAAPVWLSLVVMGSTGAVAVDGIAPVLLVAFLLLIPKLCGLAARLRLRLTRRRLAILLRASAGELFLSAVLAPVMMVRQTAAVLSVLAGQDCGWKSTRTMRSLPPGGVEAAAGLGLAGVAAAGGPVAVLWLAPLLLSLLAAPLLIRYLEAEP